MFSSTLNLKSGLNLICFVMGFSFLATGCGQAVPGHITLSGDQPIPLVDAGGQNVELGNGPALLTFKRSLIGAQLEITSGGKSAEFKIPRKAANSSYLGFYLRAEKIDQPVDLEGVTSFQTIRTREEVTLDACYVPGWCYIGCYRYYDGRCYDRGGHPYYPPGGGYGYSNMCPGHQQVKRTYEDRREFVEVKFRDARTQDREVLGVFDGDRGMASHLVGVQALGPCVPYYYR